MGYKTATLTALLVTLAACSPGQDEIIYHSAPPLTEPTTPSVASTAATTTPTTSPTTTATTTATRAQADAATLAALMLEIGAADPFGIDGSAFHFEASLSMLDMTVTTPLDRSDATFVPVLGAVGDADRTSAHFEFSDATSVRSGRITNAQAWVQTADGWDTQELIDPAAEVLALSYGNWRELALQMIGLTMQFTDDGDLTVIETDDGSHVTLTAFGGTEDPVLMAGLPTATELWLDHDLVIRRANVQGFVFWQGAYVPATLTFALAPAPSPSVEIPQSEG